MNQHEWRASYVPDTVQDFLKLVFAPTFSTNRNEPDTFALNKL